MADEGRVAGLTLDLEFKSDPKGAAAGVTLDLDYVPTVVGAVAAVSFDFDYLVVPEGRMGGMGIEYEYFPNFPREYLQGDNVRMHYNVQGQPLKHIPGSEP